MTPLFSPGLQTMEIGCFDISRTDCSNESADLAVRAIRSAPTSNGRFFSFSCTKRSVARRKSWSASSWRGCPARCRGSASASGAGHPSGASMAIRKCLRPPIQRTMAAAGESQAEPDITREMPSLPSLDSRPFARPILLGSVAQSTPTIVQPCSAEFIPGIQVRTLDSRNESMAHVASGHLDPSWPESGHPGGSAGVRCAPDRARRRYRSAARATASRIRAKGASSSASPSSEAA